MSCICMTSKDGRIHAYMLSLVSQEKGLLTCDKENKELEKLIGLCKVTQGVKVRAELVNMLIVLTNLMFIL